MKTAQGGSNTPDALVRVLKNEQQKREIGVCEDTNFGVEPADGRLAG